jgi:hypothetical protein
MGESFMFHLRYLWALLIILFSSQTSAYGVFLKGAIEYGGDTLLESFSTDGENEELKAGSLFLLGGGFVLQPQTEGGYGHSTEIGFFYKFDSIDYRNANFSFDRYPIELIHYIHTPSFKFGFGATYHLSPKISADSDFLGEFDFTFDNALGGILEVGLPLNANKSAEFIIRATIIEYKEKATGITADGSSLGAGFAFYF